MLAFFEQLGAIFLDRNQLGSGFQKRLLRVDQHHVGPADWLNKAVQRWQTYQSGEMDERMSMINRTAAFFGESL